MIDNPEPDDYYSDMDEFEKYQLEIDAHLELAYEDLTHLEDHDTD